MYSIIYSSEGKNYEYRYKNKNKLLKNIHKNNPFFDADCIKLIIADNQCFVTADGFYASEFLRNMIELKSNKDTDNIHVRHFKSFEKAYKAAERITSLKIHYN